MNKANFKEQIRKVINEELENAKYNIEQRIEQLIKNSAYSDELSDLPNITTEEMGLSVYVIRRLEYAGIKTLKDICGCTEKELSHIRGIGKDSLLGIKRKVEEYGYSLRQYYNNE